MDQVSAGTFAQAGKAVAAHVSYHSRAVQRDSIPTHSPNFLKATSSLRLSGAVLQRPAGSVQLAFTNEITLVIGAVAQHTGAAETWSHLRYVTAGNNPRVCTLKLAYQGSNLRARSADLVEVEVNAQKLFINSQHDGEALVREARGDPSAGTVGDVPAVRAQACGATVHPGDIIVGDDDGILVIPPSCAEDVTDAGITQEHEGKSIADMAARGHRVEGLFPMDAHWRARFGGWAAAPGAAHRPDPAGHEDHAGGSTP